MSTMTGRSVAIPPEALDVLRQCTFDENKLLLPAQLDRKLYLTTNKVIEGLGGKWNRSQKAHLFSSLAEEACADAIVSGVYLDQVDEQRKHYNYFPTPANIVQEMFDLAPPEDKMEILEPSAGDGAILRELQPFDVWIDAVEVQPRFEEDIRESAGDNLCELFVADFLTMAPSPDKLYDAIYMNPPFSRSRDMAHVRHAYDFLRPGGVLVAIMGCGFTFREDRLAKEFRKFLHGNSVSSFWHDPLPDGAFNESGTGVSAQILTIEKPGV